MDKIGSYYERMDDNARDQPKQNKKNKSKSLSKIRPKIYNVSSYP